MDPRGRPADPPVDEEAGGHQPGGCLAEGVRVRLLLGVTGDPALDERSRRLAAALGVDTIAPVGPLQGTQTLIRMAKTDTGVERKALVDVRFVPALPGIAREL